MWVRDFDDSCCERDCSVYVWFVILVLRVRLVDLFVVIVRILDWWSRDVVMLF